MKKKCLALFVLSAFSQASFANGYPYANDHDYPQHYPDNNYYTEETIQNDKQGFSINFDSSASQPDIFFFKQSTCVDTYGKKDSFLKTKKSCAHLS